MRVSVFQLGQPNESASLIHSLSAWWVLRTEFNKFIILLFQNNSWTDLNNTFVGDTMDVWKSITHPDEILALFKYQLGWNSVTPRQDTVSACVQLVYSNVWGDWES